MSTTRQYCTFRLDNLWFGVEVDRVQEVLRTQPSTRIPLAPPAVSGLMNLRGQIITAIELRRQLMLADRDDEQPPMNVIIRCQEDVISLLVDEIDDVVHVSEDLFEAAPGTLDGNVCELINGVYRLENRLLLVLDTDRATQLAA